jgi:hypothetical protein
MSVRGAAPKGKREMDGLPNIVIGFLAGAAFALAYAAAPYVVAAIWVVVP